MAAERRESWSWLTGGRSATLVNYHARFLREGGHDQVGGRFKIRFLFSFVNNSSISVNYSTFWDPEEERAHPSSSGSRPGEPHLALASESRLVSSLPSSGARLAFGVGRCESNRLVDIRE